MLPITFLLAHRLAGVAFLFDRDGEESATSAAMAWASHSSWFLSASVPKRPWDAVILSGFVLAFSVIVCAIFARYVAVVWAGVLVTKKEIWRPRRVSRCKAHRPYRGVARYVRRSSVPRRHHRVAGVGYIDIGRVALYWLHFVRYERRSAQAGSRRLRHRCRHALH